MLGKDRLHNVGSLHNYDLCTSYKPAKNWGPYLDSTRMEMSTLNCLDSCFEHTPVICSLTVRLVILSVTKKTCEEGQCYQQKFPFLLKIFPLNSFSFGVLPYLTTSFLSQPSWRDEPAPPSRSSSLAHSASQYSLIAKGDGPSPRVLFPSSVWDNTLLQAGI